MPEKEPDLEDLDGIGAQTAEKFRDAGYDSIMRIAVSSPGDIVTNVGVGESVANKAIASAKKLANIGGFESGGDILERRSEVGKLQTLCGEFDNVLDGGLDTQSIVELYGEFGSGKTQMTHQLAVNVQLPKEKGGLDGSVIYIDTENTFRPNRIQQMVDGLSEYFGEEFDKNEFLNNIKVARAYNSSHQTLLIESAMELAEESKNWEKPVRLLIVDSIIAHFRAEYIGRGELSARQQQLSSHLNKIQQFTDMYNALAVITNQVMSDPAAMFGDPIRPIGGHIIGHSATFRLYIKKSKKDTRVIKIVDSPDLPQSEAIVNVEEKGLTNV